MVDFKPSTRSQIACHTQTGKMLLEGDQFLPWWEGNDNIRAVSHASAIEACPQRYLNPQPPSDPQSTYVSSPTVETGFISSNDNLGTRRAPAQITPPDLGGRVRVVRNQNLLRTLR